MNKNNIPTVKVNVDASEIAKAIGLANELIEKLNIIQSLTKELNDIVSSIDLSIGVSQEMNKK